MDSGRIMKELREMQDGVKNVSTEHTQKQGFNSLKCELGRQRHTYLN